MLSAFPPTHFLVYFSFWFLPFISFHGLWFLSFTSSSKLGCLLLPNSCLASPPLCLSFLQSCVCVLVSSPSINSGTVAAFGLAVLSTV